MSVSPYSYTVELFYDGQWHDITADVDGDRGVKITRGAKNEQRAYLAAPGTMRLRLNNGASFVAPGTSGRYDYRNPLSDLFGKLTRQGTLIRVRATLGVETSTRFVGEVIQWPPRRAHAGGHAWVDVEAAGITRRIGKAHANLRDTVHRLALAEGAVGYWPLDDATDSTRARAVRGGDLRVVTDADDLVLVDGQAPNFGDGSTFPWLEGPALRTTDAGALRGKVAGTPGGWAWDMVWAMRPADFGVDQDTQVTFSWVVYDENILWEVQFLRDTSTGDSDVLFFAIDRETSAILDSATFPTTLLFDGKAHVVRAQMFDNSGDDVTVHVFVDGEIIGATGNFSIGQTTPDGAKLVTAVWRAHLNARVDLGKVTLWNSDGPSATEAYAGYSGHSGEPVGRRLERVAAEEGVTLVTQGDPDATEPMGPQHPGQFLDLLAEAAKLEAAGSPLPILHEPRDDFALRLVTRRSLYTTSPGGAGLTLDYDQGDLAAQLAPAPDDLEVVNRVTAKRRGGGEATVERTEGPLSTQDPPDGIGAQPAGDTFAAATDGQVLGVAGWWLHASTWDEARHPRIPHEVRPLREVLVADAVALDVAGRLVLRNTPGSTGDVEQLTLGYGETLGKASWRQDWHTTPAGLLRVFVLDDWVQGRLDTAGSELAAGVTASDTQLLVATDSGSDPWVNTATGGRWPFAVELGGEVVRVHSIVGTTSPQLLNVDRSVNGIVKAQTAGTRLRLSHVAPWPEVEEDDVQQRIATTERVTDSATFTDTETQVMSVTASLEAGRTYKITQFSRWESSVIGDQITVRIRDDDTDGAFRGSNLVEVHTLAGFGWPSYTEAEFTAASDGPHTFIVSGVRSGGSGDCNLAASAGSRPSYLYVDYIRG